MKTKVYLASPFFNDEETKVYDEVIELLRSESDLDVFVPREHEIPGAWDMANHKWAEAVFAMSFLVPTRSKAISRRASPDIFSTLSTRPLPKAVCSTISPLA